MPYVTLEDLPNPVRAHLPEHTQEIYRAAFNRAWRDYGEHGARQDEEIAHRVAWAAVKRKGLLVSFPLSETGEKIVRRVLVILLAAVVALHAFFWLRWQEIHPCKVAVARSTVTLLDAVTKAPQLVKLMRGEDLLACYRIAILGPDADPPGEAR